ncbi:MAG: Beta-galactosidase, partial [uncultured Thermomicrobiales bacterium]
SVVLWGVRINEAHADYPAFFDEVHRLAKGLDPTRQTVGAYNHREHPQRTDVWGENDYGRWGEPLGPPHRSPYLISEAVGQKRPGGGFDQFYRRSDPGPTQQLQAERHAAVHNAAAADPRYAGVIAWCAFDYNSPHNAHAGVKTPGVCDLFRIPKPGASFYRSQCNPATRAVLEPAFYWDFGPESPPDGPGAGAMICANCERIEVYVGGVHHATARPNRARFGHLPYPPFFVDLTVDGAARLDLRLDGFIGDRLVISRAFAGDPTGDRLDLHADDVALVGDGRDMTRLVCRAVDRHGAPRPFVGGVVTFALDGPGTIVGDNPFDLGSAGGAGAVWIRAAGGRVGTVRVRAEHPALGAATVAIDVRPPAVTDEQGGVAG